MVSHSSLEGVVSLTWTDVDEELLGGSQSLGQRQLRVNLDEPDGEAEVRWRGSRQVRVEVHGAMAIGTRSRKKARETVPAAVDLLIDSGLRSQVVLSWVGVTGQATVVGAVLRGLGLPHPFATQRGDGEARTVEDVRQTHLGLLTVAE